MPVGDPSLRQIVWRQLDIHAVAHQDADAVAAHAARDGGEHHMLGVVDLHLKKGVWLFVDDNAIDFDQFFFHSVPFLKK